MLTFKYISLISSTSCRRRSCLISINGIWVTFVTDGFSDIRLDEFRCGGNFLKAAQRRGSFINLTY